MFVKTHLSSWAPQSANGRTRQRMKCNVRKNQWKKLNKKKINLFLDLQTRSTVAVSTTSSNHPFSVILQQSAFCYFLFESAWTQKTTQKHSNANSPSISPCKVLPPSCPSDPTWMDLLRAPLLPRAHALAFFCFGFRFVWVWRFLLSSQLISAHGQ